MSPEEKLMIFSVQIRLYYKFKKIFSFMKNFCFVKANVKVMVISCLN